METAEFIFSVALVVLGIGALVYAARSWSHGGRTRAVGWLVLALAAVIQAVNLGLGYSWVLSVATTAALLSGLWMVIRARNRAR